MWPPPLFAVPVHCGGLHQAYTPQVKPSDVHYTPSAPACLVRSRYWVHVGGCVDVSRLALTPAEVDKVLRHVWLTAQMHVEVRGQHVVSPKSLVVRLARCGTGDAVGAGQRHGARLVDRIVKTVAPHGGVGGTEQCVLHKRGLGIAELLQPCGHAGPAWDQ